MCGLVGFYAPGSGERDWSAILKNMTDTLAHRGPDDEGQWIDMEAGIALGHRRLSIVDLSPLGHQPMTSASGRYVMVYNGEIYNFLDLRAALEAQSVKFQGTSDTEVMLAAIECWGVTESLKRFIGMFAFALWDREEQVLYLARDRMGEKPLYYGWMQGVFLFTSELKALYKHPRWQGEINRDALALLVRHNYIHAPHSIYQGIYKLLPGSLLTLRNPGTLPEPEIYWSVREAVEAGDANPFPGNEAEAITTFEDLLKDAVRQQMIADVPLGAFLSGGIDSSTIVALMQAQSSRPVKTFSIGFQEDFYNEAAHAKAVAQHLGTDHTEVYVSPQDALDVIPKLPYLYDEPFSDSSQIPTYLVSQIARQHVTVSLSGDGGDELFYGYYRYTGTPRIYNKIKYMPGWFQGRVARSMLAMPDSVWHKGADMVGMVLPNDRRNPVRRLYKILELLPAHQPELLYGDLISHWKAPEKVVLNSIEPKTALNDPAKWAKVGSFAQHMMYADMVTYLPDDILVKVDRASMGVSLESRVPLLDHRVVEFAQRIPFSMKYRNGETKWLLKQVLYRYVPRELVDRPKMGFGIPVMEWLRGELRDWGESLLDERRLKAEGFFNVQEVRQKWYEHVTNRQDWHYYLWDVLMFQAWQDAWRS